MLLLDDQFCRRSCTVHFCRFCTHLRGGLYYHNDNSFLFYYSRSLFIRLLRINANLSFFGFKVSACRLVKVIIFTLTLQLLWVILVFVVVRIMYSIFPVCKFSCKLHGNDAGSYSPPLVAQRLANDFGC